MNDLRYAMWVVYGYAIWIAAEYAWDWWKNTRQRRYQPASHRQSTEQRVGQPLVPVEPPPTHLDGNHTSSPVQAV